MSPLEFVNELHAIKIKDVFNPYAMRCAQCDTDDAPQRRTSALLAILKVAIDRDIDSIWIGRDLGYRGGRRTGLAFTDDIHIAAHAARWGIKIDRPTKGEIIGERTATVIWNILMEIDAATFLWNVFPFHPHERDKPLSNRSHNSSERHIGEEILDQLVVLLKPKRLVAVGNDAAAATRRFSAKAKLVHVRHPSYGGQTKFIKQVRSLYGVS